VIFPTVEFAAFFAVVLVVSWLVMPMPRVWKPFMIAASYFFYGYTDWRFCALLGVATVGNQVAARVIASAPSTRRASGVVAAAVSADLVLLGVFKYLGFLEVSADSVLRAVGLGAALPLANVALPIGISFFTFQAISYVVDVYRGVIRPASNVDFALYLSFFPHLVAGPIVRGREFIPQLSPPRDPRRVAVGPAVFLILGGLFKKVVLADYLGTHLVDPVFASPATHSGLDIAAAVYGYAVQIYCDFSAYTDMAIGLALLLGFRFPQNFDRPYASASLQDFWRRWHMTLSRWLRDYLYIPLGGSRRGSARTYVNLMITMLLGGLWHGASWTFVIWGAIHGAGLAVERALRPWAARRDARLPERTPRQARLWQALQVVLTFNVVCLAWVFFRSPDLAVAGQMLTGLARPGRASVLTPAVTVALVVGLATQLPAERWWAFVRGQYARLPLLLQGVTAGIVIVVVFTLVDQQGVAPFIYFRF